MLAKNPTKRPTFFELALMLMSGRFNLMNEEGEKVPEILNPNYETGNDYLYYYWSLEPNDIFHCLIFHWYHGNKEAFIKICEKGIKDKFILYIYKHTTMYEKSIDDINDREKMELYHHFLKLNSSDYRFWLMPLPNRKPPIYKGKKKMIFSNDA